MQMGVLSDYGAYFDIYRYTAPNSRIIQPQNSTDRLISIVASLRKLNLTNRKIAETLECSPTAIRLVINNTQQSKRIADHIAKLIDKKTDDIWPGVYNYKARKPYNQKARTAA